MSACRTSVSNGNSSITGSSPDSIKQKENMCTKCQAIGEGYTGETSETSRLNTVYQLKRDEVCQLVMKFFSA